MKISETLVAAALLSTPLSSATAISIPDTSSSLFIRSPNAESSSHSQDLQKRRGGGGGGGRGSTGSSSGSSGSSGSSSTGVRGGATTPYRAGSNLPKSGAAPILAGAGLGLAGGALLFGGAPYYYYGPYGYRYPYRNNQTNTNETLPISCVCAQYNPCGCDDIDQKEVVDDQLDDGTANITTVNGTRTVVINGTLDNGTTTSGAVHEFTVAGGAIQMVWPVAVMVGAMVWGL